MTSIPPKPRTEGIPVEITRFPRLNVLRRAWRHVLIWVMRMVVWFGTRTEVHGLENVPRNKAALIVSNHLGDADLIVGLAYAPFPLDSFAKAELYNYPVLGTLLDTYGVIWLHRGQPDRRALRAALEVLSEGRMLVIAPEGRESVTGSLEEGTGGAAYLALKANVPLMPVTFTGTENSRIYGNLKRLRRTRVTMTVGPLFRLKKYPDHKEMIEKGTHQIMLTLARQLPAEYQGVFRDEIARGAGRTDFPEGEYVDIKDGRNGRR